MRDALLHDLAQLPGIETYTTYDARLAAPTDCHHAWPVDTESEVWDQWADCMQKCDAVWPIAPECDGQLYRLSRLAEAQGRRLLGCDPATISLAGSKLATSRALHAAGVPVVPTYVAPELPESTAGAWVVKPDDGVGCEDTQVFDDYAAAARHLNACAATHVMQPLLSGVPASISMLCIDGQAWLLSCNRQKVSLRQGSFAYHGSIINGMAEYWDDFAGLARQVAAALPGLRGYVGVDLMVGEGALTLLEVNPRLTTSYAGLHLAIADNPARLVLQLIYNDDFQRAGFTMPEIAHHIVEVTPSDQA